MISSRARLLTIFSGRPFAQPTSATLNRNFVFPMTPPGTAGLDALTERAQEGGRGRSTTERQRMDPVLCAFLPNNTNAKK